MALDDLLLKTWSKVFIKVDYYRSVRPVYFDKSSFDSSKGGLKLLSKLIQIP